MPESNITKKALATALKELMEEMPFEKINVSAICQRCDMNRKSFYYHFKDKYDLVNWIFDTEFIAVVTENKKEHTAEERVFFMKRICEYFYDNRTFYRRALQIKGQNSFSDHFREYIQPLLKARIIFLLGDENSVDFDEFTMDFLTDAMLCAMERWLLSNECMPAEQFVNKFTRLIETVAELMMQDTSLSGTKQQN